MGRLQEINGLRRLATAQDVENVRSSSCVNASSLVVWTSSKRLRELVGSRSRSMETAAAVSKVYRPQLVNGDEVLVGRSAWLNDQGADMSLLQQPGYEEAEGLSMLYVVRNKRCIGWIGLEDKTRPEARDIE